MKNGNDYRIIVEKKYYAVFTDGQGKEQKVEVSREIAEAIQNEQRKESALRRATERHCVSLDQMDYEGEIFATYDQYEMDDEEPELNREEKVRLVLEQMKPGQARLLKMVFFDGLTQSRIAEMENVSQASVAQRLKVAKGAFKKIFEKLF